VCIDISKLKQLGYNPKVSIEEGIERCVRWYRDNFDEILRSR
jgi:nucleoside-diphosphate-sugar epimerase